MMKQHFYKVLNPKTVAVSLVCALLGLGTTHAWAITPPGSYTLTDDDVTVVNGTITACSYDFSVNTEGTYLTIPSTLDGQTVTAIADGTGDPWTTLTGIFLNKKIKSVTLPSTLTYIGKLAFAQNTITAINFPNGLTSIGESAFYQNQLTTLSIPASVVSIRMNAFNENSSLSSVTFEANSHLVMLESHVFANTSVSSITLPTPIVPDNNFEHWIKIDGSGTTLAGGESVDPYNYAFYAKFVYTLTDADVVVENGILKSCSYDFSSKFINIPSQLDGQTVTEIAGSYSQNKAMFYGKTLMGLTLPASLTKIGDLVFNSNSIQNLTIPANVTYIGQYAFWRSGVKSVTFEENTKIITIDNGAFDNNNGLTMSLPTPVKAGFTFKKWLDGDDTEFAGGATLTNFDTSYEAQFAKATAVENNKAGAMDIFVQNNVLHIATEGQHVLELLDMSGKMILTQSISQAEPVDISHLKAGAYIARISGHDGTITQKVVKM